MCVCMYVCMYACMYVCMYVCIYVCMYLCMYVKHWTLSNTNIRGLLFYRDCSIVFSLTTLKFDIDTSSSVKKVCTKGSQVF